jgi:hypothetical protein
VAVRAFKLIGVAFDVNSLAKSVGREIFIFKISFKRFFIGFLVELFWDRERKIPDPSEQSLNPLHVLCE